MAVSVVSQKKKIAFIVPGLGNMGGSVRVAISLANRLAEYHDVFMVSVAPFDEPAFPLDGRVGTAALNLQGLRIREYVSQARQPLTALLKEQKIDLLFGIGTYETLMAVLPCRASGTKLVFCDHGALINQWDDKQMRAVRLLSALAAARTVTLTQQSREDYHRLLHIPRKRLQCIPNWIPDELLKAAHSYAADSKILLWAGRLDKEKGVDHLIAIASLLLPLYPDWTWEVCGQAVDTEVGFDIEQAIKDAGIEGQLLLQGRVDNIADYYARCAAFTLTSYREGLPLALLEGKACKLPLVSFDVNTGPRDLIEDGVDGFLVEPYDCEAYAAKLSVLMDSRDLRVRMSEASQEKIGAYSEEVILRAWLDLVESVLG